MLVPTDNAGFVHSGVERLDRQLREGDGMVWRGDSRLRLKVGVITAQKRVQHPVTGKWLNRGDIVAKRYEVWRHNEDGTDTIIGHWRMEEFDRILFDLVQMDPRTPGHVPVEERIDKANAEVDKQNSREFQEAVGKYLDHKLRLVHDRTQPKNTFRFAEGSGSTGTDEKVEQHDGFIVRDKRASAA